MTLDHTNFLLIRIANEFPWSTVKLDKEYKSGWHKKGRPNVEESQALLLRSIERGGKEPGLKQAPVSCALPCEGGSSRSFFFHTPDFARRHLRGWGMTTGACSQGQTNENLSLKE